MKKTGKGWHGQKERKRQIAIQYWEKRKRGITSSKPKKPESVAEVYKELQSIKKRLTHSMKALKPLIQKRH